MKKILFSGFIILFNISQLFASISKEISSDFLINKTHNGNTEFYNAQLSYKPGVPSLPIKIYKFLLPPDADISTVTCTIENLAQTTMDGEYNINPAALPISGDGSIKYENKNVVNGKDITIYSKDQFYPEGYIENVSVGMLHYYKIVTVEINLCNYNPISKKIKTITNGNVVVNYSQKPNKRSDIYPIAADFKDKVKDLVNNYEDLGKLYENIAPPPVRAPGYLIIADTQMLSRCPVSIANLKKLKTNEGYTVTTISQPDWGGGTGSTAASRIRSWLVNNYQSKSIKYVLFIGDANSRSGTVPMGILAYNGDQTANQLGFPYPYSDFYYAQLSGSSPLSDMYAEVSVGRLPYHYYPTQYDQPRYMDNTINRIISYETESQTSAMSWRKSALLATYEFQSDVVGAYMLEQVKNNFLSPKSWTNYRIYDRNVGSPNETYCDTGRVINALLTKKFGYFQWSTHGCSNAAKQVLYNMHTVRITSTANATNPPIVVMGSCLNGAMDTLDNIAECMLNFKSVASIAHTYLTWLIPQETNSGSFLPNSGLGTPYKFAGALIGSSLPCGDALNQARSSSYGDVYNFFTLNLYGLPDVGINSYGASLSGINMNDIKSASPDNNLFINSAFTNNHITQINFSISERSYVKLDVCNLQGRIVKTLVNGFKEAKSYSIPLNTESLSNGIYLCKLTINNNANISKKFTVLK